MDLQIPITLLGLFWAASAVGGGYVAVQKNRPVHEGVIFALVFGPLGMLVESGLPDLEAPESHTIADMEAELRHRQAVSGLRPR